ncbi:MAG: hypothetical protein V1854_06095 [Methanobacteriota archaeon]
MILKTFTLPSTRPTPSELRCSFATQITKYPHLPHGSTDRLIYRYPPAQYKTIDGAPGINDGAGISKGLKNHREHRGHREKQQISVLSVSSVVDYPCTLISIMVQTYLNNFYNYTHQS